MPVLMIDGFDMKSRAQAFKGAPALCMGDELGVLLEENERRPEAISYYLKEIRTDNGLLGTGCLQLPGGDKGIGMAFKGSDYKVVFRGLVINGMPTGGRASLSFSMVYSDNSRKNVDSEWVVDIHKLPFLELLEKEQSRL